MKKLFPLIGTIALTTFFAIPSRADFGDADFPIDMFKDGPKSYHDSWCRSIEKECRLRFQGLAMWVEGQGGIQRNQLISYRYEQKKTGAAIRIPGGTGDKATYYNYISYLSNSGRQKEALFLFSNTKAQKAFLSAFIRWRKQEPRPIANYRFPNSQGPQDTHGRDKGLNPYDNPPITDWSEKTTD